MAMYSNAKPQLLLHQPNIVHQLYPTQYKKKKKVVVKTSTMGCKYSLKWIQFCGNRISTNGGFLHKIIETSNFR